MDGSWEVFETPDVDDAAEDAPRSEPAATAEDVDAGPAPEPERVFEVFAGKRFVVDRPRGDAGRRREAPEVAGGLLESPFERFQRLQAEVAELMNDLEVGDDEDEDMGAAHSSAYEDLAKGVKTLKQSLTALKGQQGLAALLGNEESTQDDRAAAQALNKARADALRERLEQSRRDVPGDDAAATASVSFDLLYAGAAAGEDTEAAGALEARVRALEAALGATSQAPPASASQQRPLAQTVEALETQLRLLDEGTLSHLTQKAKVLNSELENSAKLRQRRRAAGDAGDASSSASNVASSEVADVLRKLDTCDAVAGSLPGLVDRLRTAQEIHQHNANLHMRLDEVDRVQAELDDAAKLDRELLETLQASLAENMERMQAHVDALQQ